MPIRLTPWLPALLLTLLAGCNDPGDTDADTGKVAERAEQTAPASASLIDHYQQTTGELLASLEEDNPDRTEALARDLIDQSLPLLDSVVLRYTDCDAYLDAVRELPNQLPTLDAQAIQNGYVQGRALPEGEARCHDAAGLLTAPALATAVARDQPDGWQDTVRGHAETARARLDGLRSVLSAGEEAAPGQAPR